MTPAPMRTIHALLLCVISVPALAQTPELPAPPQVSATAESGQKPEREKQLFLDAGALESLAPKMQPSTSPNDLVETKKSKLAALINNMVVPDSDEPFTPSFGEMKTSIVFPDEDAELMKTSLDRIERIMAAGGKVGGPELASRIEPTAPEAVVQQAPALVFKAFYVSSVVYRGPRDWMVWMNGGRITPKRNDGRVKVVGVGPDYVKLAWRAKDWDYRMQVWNDKQELTPELRKIQARQATTFLDPQSRHVYAVMRPNQTWVTVRPMVVEGDHREFEVTITPEAKTLTAEESLAEAGAIFSIKGAQEELDKKAREQANKIKTNSEKQAEPKKAQAAPQATTTAVGVGAVPAATGALPMQPMTAAPQPPTGTSPSLPSAPASLNDFLSAVTAPATPPSSPPVQMPTPAPQPTQP